MGCGSSSLKGDKQEDITEAPKPIKKVATNFSTIDYDVPSNAQRRHTEYAPHDEVRHKPAEALSPHTEKKTNPLSIDAISHPAASTQPATTTTTIPTTAGHENKLPTQTPQTPAGEAVIKTEPYKDVTTSPTAPTAPAATTA